MAHAACSGYLNSGQLVLRRTDKRFVVTVEGVLSPTAVRSLAEWCTPRIIAKEFEANEIEIDALTAWLGKPGTHPYSETHP